MRFETVTGSIYSVCHRARLIKRLDGAGQPTERVASGRRFKEISQVDVGHSVVITWDDDTPPLEGSPQDVVRTTITSPVVRVF